MEISWLGHSCFRLKGKQAIVITDDESIGIYYHPSSNINDRIAGHSSKGSTSIMGVEYERGTRSRAITGGNKYSLIRIEIR